MQWRYRSRPRRTQRVDPIRVQLVRRTIDDTYLTGPVRFIIYDGSHDIQVRNRRNGSSVGFEQEWGGLDKATMRNSCDEQVH